MCFVASSPNDTPWLLRLKPICLRCGDAGDLDMSLPDCNALVQVKQLDLGCGSESAKLSPKAGSTGPSDFAGFSEKPS